MKSLEAINQVGNGNRNVLKEEKWLKYLVLTKETKVNMERLKSVSELNDNLTLRYVKKTLEALDAISCSEKTKEMVEEVLKWSEVAKGGMPSVRKSWEREGINLFAHNEASAQIYWSEHQDITVYTLILTHGLIGQYIRGEVSLSENLVLTELIENERLTKKELEEILLVLNECILKGVSNELWVKIKDEVTTIISDILENRYHKRPLKETLRRLRTLSIEDGEFYEKDYQSVITDKVRNIMEGLFFQKQLWYVESALREFTFEEFVKIFLLIHHEVKRSLHKNKHITLEPFMNQLYYDHKHVKRVNIYKKRIIEKYLQDHSIEDILNGDIKENDHVKHDIKKEGQAIVFDFSFSTVGEKLIEFCVEAEKANVAHEQAIILLYDFFGLRKDQYDRLYNEEKYLSDMNSSGDFKRIIVDHVAGKKVIDIGPGSGVILDMVESTYPDKEVYGIDISKNVIDALEKKKTLENHAWNVVQGDALNLKDYFEPESVDTIIYSSIIHELFSYIPYEGKKFNYKTIEKALKSAFEVLSKGGRIIIRDGIKTEPDGTEKDERIIRFKDPNGMNFLQRYAKDFKGREISYKIIDQHMVQMTVNDAMEFLYTYTWGEEAYVHEINEQFGYFTPTEYKIFIQEILGKEAKILTLNHYLQEGYSEHLQEKIDIFDINHQAVSLPDSTCFIVIEKQ